MSDHKLLIQEIRRAVEDEDCELTAWEDEFLSSIATRETLTHKQDEVLLRIWRKATGQ